MNRKNSPEPFDWASLPEQYIVGIDEVGRGCLAGPVCAAAVMLDKTVKIPGLTDSKLLSESRREILAPRIKAQAQWSLGFASVAEIDQINILQATFLAMKRALEKLLRPEMDGHVHLLVDGHLAIPNLRLKQTCLVKGDLRAAPISAASVLAKVARDQLMSAWHKELPQYEFQDNKGYGSAGHREAIAKFGPTWLHRKTFGGVREYWTPQEDEARARNLLRELGGPGPS